MSLNSFKSKSDTESLNLLNEYQAAPIIKKSIYWLRRSRIDGTGPCYRKIGGNVFYDEADLLTWLQSHTRQISTKEKNL